MERVKLESIPLHAVHIQDSFWDKYIRLVKDVILPYQWDTLNDRVEGAQPSHCIKNFKIAAGEENGEFQGAVFQDTDVAKWLEAVAFTLASSGRDEKLEKLADETIALIGRAQCEDGYLNTYYTIQEPDRRWTNLKEGHELYTAGHMIEAAVAYYQATGKKEFLEIVSRFADVICEKFGPKEGQCHGYPGHPEVELALVKLYRVTKEKKYLDTAKFFIDARGQGGNYFEEEERGEKYKQIFPEFAGYQPEYSQSHLPVREQKTAEGHAVRAVYLYSAMADLAYEYQDKELEKACETLWNNMVQKRMYITEGLVLLVCWKDLRQTMIYQMTEIIRILCFHWIGYVWETHGRYDKRCFLCRHCGTGTLQHCIGRNRHGRKKFLLCKSFGSMAG